MRDADPVADLFGELCRVPYPESDIGEHLSFFVELVAAIDAMRIIELGVRHGVSTIGWLHALRQHRGGRLWSVDVEFPDYAAPICSARARLAWRGADDGRAGSTWTFMLGRDDDTVVLSMLPKEVDLVFIDTSHTLEQTTRELELYGPRVRAGGRIVLHDTAPHAAGPGLPVRTAIERYVAARGLSWTERPHCYGLGVIKI